MSVVDATEVWSRHGATITSEKASPADAVIAITQGYFVVVDDVANDDAEVVKSSPLIPQIGDYYRGNPKYRCKSVTPRRVSPIVYMVDVGYEGLPDPELSRPSISWSPVTSNESVDRDYYGRPLINAVGEPVQGLTRMITDRQLTITRRYETYNALFWDSFENTINEDVFAGYPAGRGLVTGISAQNQFSGGEADDQGYWNITVSILFRKPFLVDNQFAWWHRFRHEGTFKNVSTTVLETVPEDNDDPLPLLTLTQIVPILDGTGQRKTTPTLLKLDGTVEDNPNNAVWLLRPAYGLSTYADMGLL
jgi:hypothetical protein